MNKLYERVALLATIDPEAQGASAVITDEIDMKYWREVMFIVMVGTLGASATVDFSVKGGASTNPGSHATAVTGKAITQLTQAGGDSDKQVLLHITADELADQGLRFIEGTLTVATASCDVAVVAVGSRARYQPAQDYDLASVAEIVD